MEMQIVAQLDDTFDPTSTTEVTDSFHPSNKNLNLLRALFAMGERLPNGFIRFHLGDCSERHARRVQIMLEECSEVQSVSLAITGDNRSEERKIMGEK